MRSLEETLRPCHDTPSAYLRDGLVWMMLVALFLALLPVWWVNEALVSSVGNGELTDFSDAIDHFSRLLLSF